ncbi:hypothetical protein GO986_12600 [Deinococcus sp. HMF7620]|uniref:Uncharacterized protein n=1 Tax=Deinococcus arboris TaxID=2682977 RepID=A0A7C9IBT0_9DEIO|nr:hypothetical protein [Deinococcus arboris]MVN87606.1 hypothetical protein [Deinococcus arboris]
MDRALFLTLMVSLAGQTLAQTRVLYDSRLPAPEPRLTESERGRVESLARRAATQQVWDADAGMDLCEGSDFSIEGAAPGTFTAKGRQQTAYVYTFCFNRTGNLQGLVILEGLNVAAHYVFVNHVSSMYALKDINRNGFTELVLEGGFSGQGYTGNFLEIVELGPVRRLLGRLNQQLLPQPYEDNCGVRSSGGQWTSALIRVTPGVTSSYTWQQLTGSRGNERVAISIGPVKPLKLTPFPTGWAKGPLW